MLASLAKAIEDDQLKSRGPVLIYGGFKLGDPRTVLVAGLGAASERLRKELLGIAASHPGMSLSVQAVEAPAEDSSAHAKVYRAEWRSPALAGEASVALRMTMKASRSTDLQKQLPWVVTDASFVDAAGVEHVGMRHGVIIEPK